MTQEAVITPGYGQTTDGVTAERGQVFPVTAPPEPTQDLKTCAQCHEVKAKTAFKKDSDPPLCLKCHRARLHGKAIALADAEASLPWVTQTTAKLEKLARASLDAIEALIPNAKSPKELALCAAILIDKRAMLRGEPTQIIGHEKREQMLVLAEALTKELERRSKTINVTPCEVQPMTGP